MMTMPAQWKGSRRGSHDRRLRLDIVIIYIAVLLALVGAFYPQIVGIFGGRDDLTVGTGNSNAECVDGVENDLASYGLQATSYDAENPAFKATKPRELKKRFDNPETISCLNSERHDFYRTLSQCPGMRTNAYTSCIATAYKAGWMELDPTTHAFRHIRLVASPSSPPTRLAQAQVPTPSPPPEDKCVEGIESDLANKKLNIRVATSNNRQRDYTVIFDTRDGNTEKDIIAYLRQDEKAGCLLQFRTLFYQTLSGDWS